MKEKLIIAIIQQADIDNEKEIIDNIKSKMDAVSKKIKDLQSKKTSSNEENNESEIESLNKELDSLAKVFIQSKTRLLNMLLKGHPENPSIETLKREIHVLKSL